MHKEALEEHVKVDSFIFKELPDKLNGTTIFFISDIHRRQITETLLAKINQKVDLIIIGGDLTEKGVPLSRTATNIERLTQLGPCFFIWGNNDYEVNRDDLLDLFTQFGVMELKNNIHYLFQRNMVLIGIDDFTQELPPLDPLFNCMERESFKILLCHNPATIDLLPNNHQISMALCGHTHGGQIRIFGFGPYKHGTIEKVNQMTVLTSNGYGTSLFPLRLGAKPETHLIHLQKSTL